MSEEVGFAPQRIEDEDDSPTHRRKTRGNFEMVRLAIGGMGEWFSKSIRETKDTIIKPAIRGGFNVGDVRYFGTIAKAVAAIPSNKNYALYITNIQAVTASLTVPSNITIIPLIPNAFSVASGVTLTINRLQADDYQVVKTGSGTLAVTALTYRRSVMWYGATGDGSTSDSTAVQMACADLPHRCKLVFPSPSSYYRLTAILEIADKNGAVIDFCPAWDTALASIPDTYPLFYDGATVTGYENAVVRVVGNSYSVFHGLAVHANSKADYALFYSGINAYTGSGTTTANRFRSIGNQFRGFANLGVNKCGARLGEDTSTSSQTDICAFHNSYFRSNTTGSSLGVDASPVYRGMEIHGANTYIDFYTCEASGDTAYYVNAGSINFYGSFALGDSREGWYINDQTSSVSLYSCHAEGISGRAIRLASGDSVSARVLKIKGGTFLHADKGSKTFNAATAIDTGTDIFTINAHTFATDDIVVVGLSGATFPVTASTITDGEVLYVIRSGADTFQLSRTLAGSAINFTGAGSGTVTLTWRAAPMRFEGNMSVVMDGVFGEGWIGSPTGFTNAPPVFVDKGCHWLHPTEHGHNPDIQTDTYVNFTRANKETVKRYRNNLRQSVVDSSGGTETASKGASFANYIVVNSGAGNSFTLPAAKKGMVIWCHKVGSGAMTINMPPEKTFDASTAMNTSTEVLSLTGHDFLEGTAAIVDLNGGTFPVTATVIATGDTLYCGYIDTNTMYLARSEALAFNPTPIDFTSAGSGTIKLYRGQLQRHDGGTASSVVAEGTQEGCIEFKCIQDGKWQVTSLMNLGYDSQAALNPGQRWSKTADTTVADTTTETTVLDTGVGSKDFPANWAVAGRSAIIRFSGHFSTLLTPTLRFRVKIGSVTIEDSGAVATASGVASGLFFYECRVTFRSAGGSGTAFSQMLGWNGSVQIPAPSTGTSTIDTTAAQTLNVTVEWGTASASNTITCTNAQLIFEG